MNNFNSLMSIIAGLNNAAASRLKYSLGVVHNALFEEFEKLEAIMSPQKNFGVYRTTVSECAAPVIPYMYASLYSLCGPAGTNTQQRNLFDGSHVHRREP